MTPLIVILTTAIIYALIRAKHDSYLLHGDWKRWAVIEAVFWTISFTAVLLYGFQLHWAYGLLLAPVFAFSFWLFFDCIVGYLFTGNILYLGEKGWDKKMRAMFLYNKPIFGWKETGAIRMIFFKCFWLTLLILSYLSL